jgi:hypothetical protein
VRNLLPSSNEQSLFLGIFSKSHKSLILCSVWRPLHHPVEDWPLTLCDGTTITYDDLLSTDVVREDFEEHVGSNMFVMHRETSRWYYISKQKPNEAWIFKQYDTNERVMARCTCAHFYLISVSDLLCSTRDEANLFYLIVCAHASFMHQVQPNGILPRESVEVRALVFTDA